MSEAFVQSSIAKQYFSLRSSMALGGYACECYNGAYYDEDSKSCIETNECTEDPDICGEGVCKNKLGGYSCECEGRFRHTPIYNPIEKSCSNPGCGDIHINYSNGPPEVKEITGDICGSENIGTCEALPVEYGPDCEDFEANCSCESKDTKKLTFMTQSTLRIVKIHSKLASIIANALVNKTFVHAKKGFIWTILITNV